MGKTRDDAIGEAFDKVARVVGLGYPGGPKVDNLAKQGTSNIKLPVTHFENLDFSFSGIKTAVINLNHKDPNIDKEYIRTIADTVKDALENGFDLEHLSVIEECDLYDELLEYIKFNK